MNEQRQPFIDALGVDEDEAAYQIVRARQLAVSNVLLGLTPSQQLGVELALMPNHPQRRKRTLLGTYEVYETAKTVRDMRERKYRAEGGSGLTEFQVRKTNRGFGLFMRETL